MTLWISLAAVLVVLFLITRRIGISLEGSEDGFTVSGSFSRLRFTIYPRTAGRDKKEVKQEEDKGEESKPKERHQRDKIKNAMEWLQLLQDFSDVVRKSLNFIRRYGRIVELNLKGRVGAGDPYLTGTFYGLLEAVKGILDQAVPSSRVDVRPEFEEEKLDLAGTFEVDIRLMYIVFLIIFALWSLPKRKIWWLMRS